MIVFVLLSVFLVLLLFLIITHKVFSLYCVISFTEISYVTVFLGLFFWKKFYRKLQKEKLYKQHSPTLSLAVPFVNSLFYLLCHLFSPPSLLFFSPFEVTYIMALYDYYSVLTCSKFFFTKNPCSLDQRNI